MVAVIHTFSFFLRVFAASRSQSCGLLCAHVRGREKRKYLIPESLIPGNWVEYAREVMNVKVELEEFSAEKFNGEPHLYLPFL